MCIQACERVMQGKVKIQHYSRRVKAACVLLKGQTETRPMLPYIYFFYFYGTGRELETISAIVYVRDKSCIRRRITPAVKRLKGDEARINNADPLHSTPHGRVF